MGGTSGSLGVQPEPTVFISSDSVVTAPVICYESIYGDYLAEYVRKGAQWIAVITNDDGGEIRPVTGNTFSMHVFML